MTNVVHSLTLKIVVVQILLGLVLLFCFCRILGKWLFADVDKHEKHEASLFTEIMARAQQWQKEPNNYSWCFFCCICLEQCVYGQDVMIFVFLLFCLEVCVVINCKWGPHCVMNRAKKRVVFCILSTCHLRITFVSTASILKQFYLRCQVNKIWKSR